MPLPDLKSYVIETVDSADYYKSRFGAEFNPKVKSNVKCVFHPDSTASLSINLQNGGARCFASSCDTSIGNIVHFESVAAKITEQEAAQRLYEEFVRPIVPTKTQAAFRAKLKADGSLATQLARTTGLNPATVEKFEIGYDAHRRRYTFPVYNAFGQIVNVRFYRPKGLRKAGDIKIYSLVEHKDKPEEIRYGGIELFPQQFISEYTSTKPVFVMASEKETMLAIQLGLQAVCSTNGEGSWDDAWTNEFLGMDIGVLMDPDKGGTAAADKLIATLQKVTNICRKITLPFAEDYKGDKDFDDWIRGKQGNVFKLLQIFREETESLEVAEAITPTLSFETPTAGGPALPSMYDEAVHEVLEVQNNKAMMNTRVKTRGTIAAVATRTFDIPWNFLVKTKSGTKVPVEVPAGRDLISFVNANDDAVSSKVSSLLGKPIVGIKTQQWVGVFEAELVPIADVGSDMEGRYTIQRCFCLGTRIDANVPYELEVIPTTLSGTQEKVFVIVKAVEVARAIDTWAFTEKQQNELRIFQPSDGQSVIDKLFALAEEIASNHTKIFARPDWHIVALLTWCSPIGWYFPGEPELQRGWVNALAVGDTKTGKSKVVESLQKLFKLGDVVNAENCTFVGLVGGAIKTGNGQMMLRWGRLPLCDRKLVILEELSGLSITDISHMSEVRSRGIARLDKGGLSSQTPARTRLLALSNVRSRTKTLASYLSGVKAIQDLIGHPEDISRFDLIVTLVDDEVSSEVINSIADEAEQASFTPDQLQRLCQFVWALKPTQLRFSDDAYTSCLAWTQKLQAIYHPSVPIFKAASGRFILARVAAAIATLQFAWDGSHVIIEKAHVDAGVHLLRLLWDKPSFGYLEYSKQMADREQVRDVDDLEMSIKSNMKLPLVPQIFESLIHAAKFSRDELAATASLQIFQADEVIGYMLRSRVIRKGEANVWEVTKAGKEWMLKQIKEPKPSGKSKV